MGLGIHLIGHLFDKKQGRKSGIKTIKRSLYAKSISALNEVKIDRKLEVGELLPRRHKTINDGSHWLDVVNP